MSKRMTVAEALRARRAARQLPQKPGLDTVRIVDADVAPADLVETVTPAQPSKKPEADAPKKPDAK